MKRKFGIGEIVCIEDEYSFNPAYKVLSIGEIISIEEGKTLFTYRISGHDCSLLSKDIKKCSIKNKFNINQIVKVKESIYYIIGKIESIHIYRGKGMSIGEDKRGLITYSVEGCYSGRVESKDITLAGEYCEKKE